MVAIGLAGGFAGDGSLAAGPGAAIPVGCPVYDVEGAKVGTVIGADFDVLLVEHALILQDQVPFAAVAAFDGEAVRLRVDKDAVRRGDYSALDTGHHES